MQTISDYCCSAAVVKAAMLADRSKMHRYYYYFFFLNSMSALRLGCKLRIVKNNFRQWTVILVVSTSAISVKIETQKPALRERKDAHL